MVGAALEITHCFADWRAKNRPSFPSRPRRYGRATAPAQGGREAHLGARPAAPAPELNAQLLLEDRFLLRVLLEQPCFRGEEQLGGAIECIFFSEGQDAELIKLTMPKAVETTSTMHP